MLELGCPTKSKTESIKHNYTYSPHLNAGPTTGATHRAHMPPHRSWRPAPARNVCNASPRPDTLASSRANDAASSKSTPLAPSSTSSEPHGHANCQTGHPPAHMSPPFIGKSKPDVEAWSDTPTSAQANKQQ